MPAYVDAAQSLEMHRTCRQQRSLCFCRFVGLAPPWTRSMQTTGLHACRLHARTQTWVTIGSLLVAWHSILACNCGAMPDGMTGWRLLSSVHWLACVLCILLASMAFDDAAGAEVQGSAVPGATRSEYVCERAVLLRVRQFACTLLLVRKSSMKQRPPKSTQGTGSIWPALPASACCLSQVTSRNEGSVKLAAAITTAVLPRARALWSAAQSSAVC